MYIYHKIVSSSLQRCNIILNRYVHKIFGLRLSDDNVSRHFFQTTILALSITIGQLTRLWANFWVIYYTNDSNPCAKVTQSGLKNGKNSAMHCIKYLLALCMSGCMITS